MSQYSRYRYRKATEDRLLYEFTSNGPRGKLKLVVQFEIRSDQQTYNLAMGNLKEDGSIDDLIVNNNKDRDKVLATVAAIVDDFTLHHPDRFIFFSGSTPGRTRLYRMALTINYPYLSGIYHIWGLFENLIKRK